MNVPEGGVLPAVAATVASDSSQRHSCCPNNHPAARRAGTRCLQRVPAVPVSVVRSRPELGRRVSSLRSRCLQGPGSLRHPSGPEFNRRLARVAPKVCSACGQRDTPERGVTERRAPSQWLKHPAVRMRTHAAVLVCPQNSSSMRCHVGGGNVRRMLRVQAAREFASLGASNSWRR